MVVPITSRSIAECALFSPFGGSPPHGLESGPRISSFASSIFFECTRSSSSSTSAFDVCPSEHTTLQSSCYLVIVRDLFADCRCCATICSLCQGPERPYSLSFTSNKTKCLCQRNGGRFRRGLGRCSPVPLSGSICLFLCPPLRVMA